MRADNVELLALLEGHLSAALAAVRGNVERMRGLDPDSIEATFVRLAHASACERVRTLALAIERVQLRLSREAA